MPQEQHSTETAASVAAAPVSEPQAAAWLKRGLYALLGLFLFVLALQLLRDGAAVYGNQVRGLLVQNTANALGLGWLMAYIFLSGSPVAAIAVSFFASGALDATQAFTMITGSRLGASFIVLFVGFLYYLRGQPRSASVSIGVLSLLTTAAIYLPALLLGYLVLTSPLFQPWQIAEMNEAPSIIKAIYGPIMAQIDRLGLPGWGLFLGGIAVLLGAFKLLDSALPEISADRNAFRNIGRLVYRPMAMFMLGALVTSVTMSVSVSLSILVPLSAKGLVRRENTLPYIMGANITTFIDTLIAALSAGGPAAFMIVLIEMLSVTLISLIVLLAGYRWFERTILRLQERIIRTNTSLGVFVGVMLLIPIGLLLMR